MKENHQERITTRTRDSQTLHIQGGILQIEIKTPRHQLFKIAFDELWVGHPLPVRVHKIPISTGIDPYLQIIKIIQS